MFGFNKLEQITEQLKIYFNTNIDLLKLEATERISIIGSSLISGIIVWATLFLFVFTFSIGLGFFLSELFGNSYMGFILISGFYLVLTLFILITKSKLIETPVRDKIIRKLLK